MKAPGGKKSAESGNFRQKKIYKKFDEMKIFALLLLCLIIAVDAKNSSQTANNTSFENAKYDAVKSFEALGKLLKSAFKVVIHPSNKTLRLDLQNAAIAYQSIAGNSSVFNLKDFNETFSSTFNLTVSALPPSSTAVATPVFNNIPSPILKSPSIPSFKALKMESEDDKSFTGASSKKQPSVSTGGKKPKESPVTKPFPTKRPIHSPYVFPISAGHNLKALQSLLWIGCVVILAVIFV